MLAKARLLLSLARNQVSLYVVAAVLLLCGVVFFYAAPLLTGLTIDLALDAKSGESRIVELARSTGLIAWLPTSLGWSAVLIVAMTVAGGALTFGKMRLGAMAAERITRSLRQKLYDHLQKLPCGYHDSAQTGDLVQRCSSDVETVRLFYADQILEIVRAVVLIGVAIPIMFWIDWKLALSAICVMPIVVVFAIVFFWKVHGTFKAMDEAEGSMTTAIQENLTGIRVVRAFARGEFERQKFARRNGDHRAKHWNLYKVLAVYWASSDFMCFTQIVIYVLYGASRVADGDITVGTLVTFMQFTGMYIWPVRHMGRVITDCGKATVAIGRIAEVLDAPEESQPASPVAHTFAGHVRFEGVEFKHRDTTVLSGVSFDVPAGSTVALLGPSGSGKTTLAQLLLRFHDPSSGRIFVDGVDLLTMNRHDVRRQIGVVMQEPFLFSRTIRDNIRFARPGAADDDVVDVAAKASIDESIRKFEKSYDTVVGERGVTLSGGQRQRVAIARALLRDAPILILDDALSAVDTRTESTILQALTDRAGRRTTVLIAHRLSTLMHADQIIVLDRGRIVQRGTHESLIAEEGMYQRLWRIQSELEEDLKTEMEADADSSLTSRV
jgi:ATP-binding cassette, subfamily B, bacterial